MPFADYPDFKTCVRRNQDKRDPEAYCGYIKHKVEDVSPHDLVKKINDLRTQKPSVHLRDILKEVFTSDFEVNLYPISYSLVSIREDSLAELKEWIKEEGLSKDEDEIEEIAFKILKSRKKGSGSSESKEKDKKESWKKGWKKVGKEFEERRKARELKKQEEEEKAKEHEKKQQLIKEIGVATKKKTLEKVEELKKKKEEKNDLVEDAKVSEVIKKKMGTLFNRKTGKMIEGEQYFPTEEELEGFVPVDSSNVMSGTVLGKNLVMNFLDKPNKAYKFNFQTERAASEAFNSFINAPSKGKWVWQFLRGHQRGEKVTPEKIGPSLEKGIPTIGGTSASLEPYEISSTNLVELQLKSRINKERLENLKSVNPSIQKEVAKAREKGRMTKSEKLLTKQRGLRELRYALKSRDLYQLDFGDDEIWIEDFEFIHHDENHHDFSVLTGPITRSGAFPYKLGGEDVLLYKQWNNLKDIFSRLNYIPLIGTQEIGAHRTNDVLGFAHNFIFNEDTQQVFADIVTLEDIHVLTNNFIPIEGWEVSIGFKDRRIGDKQIIDAVDHLAISLLNKEKGRCGANGGQRCYLEIKNDFLFDTIHDQNQLIEVIS